MYHSMRIIPNNDQIFNGTTGKFNGINTWDDWHLMPSSRPLVSPPGIKTQFVDIPGADGSLDLTEAYNNRVLYGTRGGSFEFYVMNGYGNWATRYSNIMEYLHGKKVKMILEDDPSWYYIGRMSVNQWQSVKDYSRITLDYSFDPYKYRVQHTNENWLWDPFNFETDMVPTSYQKIDLNGSTETVVREFSVGGPTTMSINIYTVYRENEGDTLEFALLDQNNVPVTTVTTPMQAASTTYTYDEYSILSDFILTPEHNKIRVRIIPDPESWSETTSEVWVYFGYREKRL